MKLSKRYVLLTLLLFVVIIKATALYSNNIYSIPENLPGRTGGPYISLEEVKDIAQQASSSRHAKDAKIQAIVLTTHRALIDAGIFSESYSVADDREVYLVTVRGSFTFSGMSGQPPIRSPYANISIDATNGDVLSMGTREISQNSEVLSNLKLKKDTIWFLNE